MIEIVKELDDLELVPTSHFKYGTYPFPYFNKLQSLYYPFHDQDKNGVITATTSAGKTICAEMAIGQTLQKKKKAVFLCPLKALSQEKFDSWTSEEHFLSKYNIEILTGDHKLTESKLGSIRRADVIIMTSEMLDTRTRFHSSPSSDWLKEVDLLVIDEAHLLATSRGPALEAGLMRFTSLLPKARLLLLSATMSNGEDVAKWVQFLNKKKTFFLATKWRPVALHSHPISAAESLSRACQILSILLAKKDRLALHLTSSVHLERTIAEARVSGNSEDKKTLVFVHTKKEGKKLEDTLTRQGIQAKFHNADLDKSARSKLEKEFKENLDVLIATSTLAWGINLPARHVIIVGENRGNSKVDPIDIAQMSGRAGRFGMYDRGDVWLINCSLPESFTVNSNLSINLAFHLVAEISSGSGYSRERLEEWFARSFLYFQHYAEPTKTQVASSLLVDALTKLRQHKAVQVNLDGTYSLLPFGKIARDLYLDPVDVSMLAENFSFINRNDLWENDSFLAWGLTEGLQMFRSEFTPPALKPFTANYQSRLLSNRQHRKSIQESAKLAAAIFHFRLERECFDDYQAKDLEIATAQHFQLFIRDFGRIFSALQRISSLYNWGREKEIDATRIRILNGVGKHLVDLVKIPGIGGTIATQLYKAGIKNLASLRENRDNLDQLIPRKGNVTRILNGLKELEREEEAIDF